MKTLSFSNSSLRLSVIALLIYCLALSGCVQTPPVKPGDYALLISNYPILRINGEDIDAESDDRYKKDIKAGDKITEGPSDPKELLVTFEPENLLEADEASDTLVVADRRRGVEIDDVELGPPPQCIEGRLEIDIVDLGGQTANQVSDLAFGWGNDEIDILGGTSQAMERTREGPREHMRDARLIKCGDDPSEDLCGTHRLTEGWVGARMRPGPTPERSRRP